MKNESQGLALKFENVSYKYAGMSSWVLDNINLEVPKGSFSIVTGPTGCGKTTLLMLSRGFHKEYGGELRGDIYVADQKIQELPLGDLGKKVGVIFQDPAYQLHQLRVIDEVMSALIYQGKPWQECKITAEKLTEKILATSYYDREPSELSSGEQQKVAIAACLATKCDILLLDEPFSFLDIKAANEVLEILLGLKKEGNTVVIATHNLEQVAKYADRMVLIVDGRIICEGLVKEILYSKHLERHLGVPLSIRIAKTLIKEDLLKKKVTDWRELAIRIDFCSPKAMGQMQKIPEQRERILELQNVSYEYLNAAFGVQNISLDVYQGEILGIIGSNGCGKTTLAKLILGILKPSAGMIKLFGEDITKLRTSLIARKIGYITQNPADMLFEDSVIRECAFGPKVLELDSPMKRAKNALQQLNLLRYESKHPDSLSEGEKRLLSIADILVNEPVILILDEPEFGLDYMIWKSIECLIRKFKKEGKTAILITHNLEYALFLCDRIAMMGKGNISKIGKPTDIFLDTELLKGSGFMSPMFDVLKKVTCTKTFRSEEEFIENIIISKSDYDARDKATC